MQPGSPGVFVAVVGASGAGKDTILAGTRAALAGDPAFLFPRRIITRPADGHEDNEAVSEAGFEECIRRGDFLLWWRANHFNYGLPAGLEQDLRQGRHIIANVSRTVIGEIRSRFSRCLVIEIRVDPAVLIGRLAQRGRENHDAQEARFQRSAGLTGLPAPDLVIDNNGEPEAAIAWFVKVLQSLDARAAAQAQP